MSTVRIRTQGRPVRIVTDAPAVPQPPEGIYLTISGGKRLLLNGLWLYLPPAET